MKIDVIKRNKNVEEFELEKIINVLKRAFEAKKTMYTMEILEKLALRVTAKMQKYIIDQNIDIEKIQDTVENVLIQADYTDVAKAYILYRKQHEKIRKMQSTCIDFKNIVNTYLNSKDWRVKENATVTYSIGGLILHNSGSVIANYWLSEVYDEEIATLHKNGDFHIHDLSMLSGYCAGWSLRQLLLDGMGGVVGKISSSPAKHLYTIINQMVNFLGVMQNEWAGAQAFSSFDTYLAPFVKKDNLDYKTTKQCIQSFIYDVNTPSRWGTQAPFTNITLDWVVPEDLAYKKAIVGGEEQNFTYNDCQKEMDLINKVFLEIMAAGDAQGRGFQYPIPTYNITKNFDWDNENAKLLFEITAKYGTPNFQNFINSDLNPCDVRSMCCRLQLDKRELRRRGGGLFGSDEFTGSIGIVTLNLPKLAYQSDTKEIFFKNLEHLMNNAKRSLETKRKIIKKLYDEGLYPYTEKYLKNFDNHFSTIGIVGMNEATLNAKWLKKPLYELESIEFAKEMLDFMKNKLEEYQEETHNLYNLESTPAESTSYRLAKIDKKLIPDIITSGENDPYYTNSTNFPVDFTEDLFECLKLQEGLQQKYTGGTMFHAFLGEKISDWKTTQKLVKKIATNYRIPYYTLSPTYSICKNDGYIKGEVYKCPYCDSDTEVYSRITGYYRPISGWNKGKREEFRKRKTYKIENSEKKSVNKVLRKILFTTNTCPNCPEAKKLVKDLINIEIIDAHENIDLANKYSIRSVPSLVIDKDQNINIFLGIENIREYLK